MHARPQVVRAAGRCIRRTIRVSPAAAHARQGKTVHCASVLLWPLSQALHGPVGALHGAARLPHPRRGAAMITPLDVRP